MMSNNDIVIKVSDVIAPIYYDQYKAIKQEQYTYYWNHGGRGSTKSSFISISIILGLKRDSSAHAIIFMKHAVNLRESVVEQMQWALDKLNLSDEWKLTLSPMRYTHKLTGQKIIFRGLDDPNKTKGVKVAAGYFKYIWFEELSEFDNWDEIRTAIISLFRKGDENEQPHFSVFLSYNPPREPNNWVNKLAKEKWDNRYTLHTTYLDVPNEWLTKEFLADALKLKEIDRQEYDHIYLGVATGRKGLVYPQFDRKKHVIKKLDEYERVVKVVVGCDGGTINDATTAVPIAFTTKGRLAVLPTFYYDPQLSGHQPLAYQDQVYLITNHLDKLADRFNFSPSIVSIVVDSAASDLTLTFNRFNLYAAIGVGKKDIFIDMRRVQAVLSQSDYFVIVNDGYYSPITHNKIQEDDMLILELESIVIDEKSGRPEDGNDHAIDALKYGTKLVEQILAGG